MATILAHITIKPGMEGAFEATVKPLFAASHAEEKALKRYEYWRGQEPGAYYCLLAFDDYAGFMAHQTSPHHEGAVAALGDQIADIRLEWVDPVQGASPLPTTEAGAVGEGASDLARQYAKLFPVALAGWWAGLRS